MRVIGPVMSVITVHSHTIVVDVPVVVFHFYDLYLSDKREEPLNMFEFLTRILIGECHMVVFMLHNICIVFVTLGHVIERPISYLIMGMRSS